MEEWKQIDDTDYYINRNGVVVSRKFGKERILKQFKSNGYYTVTLMIDKKKIPYSIHRLLGIYFLGIDKNSDCVIDHIDNNKTNNCLDNLQITTSRINTSKDQKNKTSKYTGVSWKKENERWMVHIAINNNRIHLGYFDIDDEDAAGLMYQNAVKHIDEYENNNQFRKLLREL
jgi:hypothetical protein